MKRLLAIITFVLAFTIHAAAQGVGGPGPQQRDIAWVTSAPTGSSCVLNRLYIVKSSGAQYMSILGTCTLVGAGTSGIPPFTDTTTIIKGSATASKLLRFEVDGFTASTTRVITPPDSDTTLPIASQVITFAGPTAARTITLPDTSTTLCGTNSVCSGYAPLASPTFTGTATIPTPFVLGATSVTSTGTQLNYLSGATGTTGTTSTNVVFSTSPTLVTPVLGAATATSINFGGTVISTYTETTCTLTLKFGGGSTGLTYTASVCKYTQVGDLVSLDAYMLLSAKGSSTGTATITGLPVAATNAGSRFQFVPLTIYGAIYVGTVFGQTDPTATTTINLFTNSGGTAAVMNDTQFSATSTININVTYKTN